MEKPKFNYDELVEKPEADLTVEEKRFLKKEKKARSKLEAKKKKADKKPVEAPKKKVFTVKTYETDKKLTRPNKGEPILYDEAKENILITSALPYVNNVPHLGNLIGCVLSADIYARYIRQIGKNALYICGTDEFGTATEVKALKEKITPYELCSKYKQLHEEIYEWFDIDFDYFGRTCTDKHKEIALDIFGRLKENGFIKKDRIEQFKCNECDLFLADRLLYGKCYMCDYEKAKGDQCDGCSKLIDAAQLIDIKCTVCDATPELKQSHHYFLSLPSIEEKLNNWVLKTSEEGKWTENCTNMTLAYIKEGLLPRCITRDLKWGVKVPAEGDEEMENKVFYVWFDAPIGYISITANFFGNDEWKKWWFNPDKVKYFQFLGKDNITFHTVTFPSTLMSARDDFTLVHHLSTTEFLNYEGTKFSKTNGTGVFGDHAKASGIPSEVWRYYLVATRPEQKDADFLWSDFAAKNNSELNDNLGNFTQRVLSFLNNFDFALPEADLSKTGPNEEKLISELNKRVKAYFQSMDAVKIKDGLRVAMEISGEGNAYLQSSEPWKVIKTAEKERCATIIRLSAGYLRLLTAFLEPFIPGFAVKVYEMMNIEYNQHEQKLLERVKQQGELTLKDVCEVVSTGQKVTNPLPIFRKSALLTQLHLKKWKNSESSTDKLTKLKRIILRTAWRIVQVQDLVAKHSNRRVGCLSSCRNVWIGTCSISVHICVVWGIWIVALVVCSRVWLRIVTCGASFCWTSWSFWLSLTVCSVWLRCATFRVTSLGICWL